MSMNKNPKEVLIIIPAFNEEANIEKVLQKLEEPEIASFADVLVVNDASTDNTGRIVKDHHNAMIEHIYNMGYGSSLQIGYKYAVRRGYQYVIQMDGDGQHDICNVRPIYDALKTKGSDGRYPDIVLGSRYMEGSSEFPISFAKKIAVGFFRWIIRRTTHRDLHDPTTGLQGLSRHAFLYYSKYHNFNDQYPDANILIQMMILDFSVVEIPAVMHPRVSGTSMHSGLRPVIYMIRLGYEICSVLARYRLFHTDRKEGLRESEE